MTTSEPAPETAGPPETTGPTGPTETTGPLETAKARPDPGWTEIGVAVVAYVLVGFVVAVLAVLVVPGYPGTGVAAALVAAGAAGLSALGASGAAVAVRVRTWAAIGLRATTTRWLALGLGAGLLSWGIARGIIAAFFALTGDHSNPQANLTPAITGSLPGLIAIIALGAVLVPVGEELLFRGVLATALGRYGAVVAVGVSALVFGLAHGPNVVGLAVVPLGVLNAIMLRRSGSVWPGVVAHATNNLLVFVLGALLT